MGSKPHVVIFPFMAQGHTIPLLDLSKSLSLRGLKVTIISTPVNISSVKNYFSQRYSQNVHVTAIPFPENVPGLPIGCENMSQTRSPAQVLAFLNATKLLREPFEAALRTMIGHGGGDGEAPTCVVSDTFLGWTNSVCRELGVPRVVFNGMGVFATTVKKALSVHDETLECDQKGTNGDGDKVAVKGVELSFDLRRRDLPTSLRASELEISKFYLEAEISDLGSWAVIANTFVELENGFVSHLEALYGNGTRAFCVGPLHLYEQIQGNNDVGPRPCEDWAHWLDRRGEEREKSVIYASFGSQASLSDEQLDELAHGLEQSGKAYIWIVRSKSWINPTEAINGLVLRDWVDQKWIMAHRAVGGFLSHCGWNSVLESLVSGVPMLAWPMQAEQHLNAKYVVEGLGAGIGLESGWARDGTIVGRDEICKGVEELMKGVRGSQARDKAIKLGQIAKRAVQIGGSSYNCLNEIVGLIKEEKYKASEISRTNYIQHYQITEPSFSRDVGEHFLRKKIIVASK